FIKPFGGPMNQTPCVLWSATPIRSENLGTNRQQFGGVGHDPPRPALQLFVYFSPLAMSLSTCFSTTVPWKKSGFMPVHNVVGLVNTKSRKSVYVITPCSTIS